MFSEQCDLWGCPELGMHFDRKIGFILYFWRNHFGFVVSWFPNVWIFHNLPQNVSSNHNWINVKWSQMIFHQRNRTKYDLSSLCLARILQSIECLIAELSGRWCGFRSGCDVPHVLKISPIPELIINQPSVISHIHLYLDVFVQPLGKKKKQ